MDLDQLRATFDLDMARLVLGFALAMALTIFGLVGVVEYVGYRFGEVQCFDGDVQSCTGPACSTAAETCATKGGGNGN